MSSTSLSHQAQALRGRVVARFVVADLIVAVLVVVSLLVHAADTSSLVNRLSYLVPIVFAAASACVAAAGSPRAERLVPWLIATGVTATAVGDVVWQVLDAAGVSPSIPVDHPPRVAGFVLLSAAMWVAISRTRPGGRMGGVFALDAATVIIVTGLVLWSVSFGRTATDDGVPAYALAVWVAYPIADALLFALLLRLVLNRRALRAIGIPFAVGVVVWLASDLAYLVAPRETYRLVLESAWMVAPVILGRGAWSWREVEPAPQRRSRYGWLVGLSFAVIPLFVPPLLEVIADLRGEDHSPLLFGVASAGLIAVAFLRTARLMLGEERALRELRETHTEALAASRTKSEFVAATSHQIRTPLATVLASAEMLQDTELDEDQADLRRRIHRSGWHLRTLVDDILDFSSIEGGHLELALAPFDLHDLAGGLADTYRARAAEAGLAFESRVDPRLPQHVVGDAGRLQQLAGNLLDNALKFTAKGHVRLEVRPGADRSGVRPADGVLVEVVVSDTGIGIPVDQQATVFDAFEQVDGSSTRRYGGTGLGLAICRELAELAGGTIELTSEPGVGSTFVVRLPFDLPSDVPLETPALAGGPGPADPVAGPA